MPIYEKCPSCNGKGDFDCDDCICQECEGEGKVSCPRCTNGYVPCGFCNSTGKISKKFIFSYSAPCPKCEGRGKLSCTNCNGSVSVVCSQCNGTGRMASCSKCNGTKKVKCVKCGGKGQVESEWFKSLHNLPDERLYFEYEKRQREVQQLTMEEISLYREIEEMRREDRRIMDLCGVEEYNRRLRGGQLPPIPEAGRHGGNLGRRRVELEGEMKAIQEVLESRHS